ncbi:hypothetical protein [Streptomyces sp. NPDC047061]|uniref:hypothetical protein n=1 Tax=Streptomyces sp. NPDC047061 TaxID=3154605 RepID=UPI0033EDE99E
MTTRIIEPLGDAAPEATVRPDCSTPSTEVTVVDETVVCGYGPVAAGVAATGAAAGSPDAARSARTGEVLIQ